MRNAAAVAFSLCLLAAGPAVAAELIDINTADQATLETLPGIGPSKAAAIIQYRTDHGPFAAKADIQNVSGIGPATYAQIAPLITVTMASAPAESPPSGDASSTPALAETMTPPAVSDHGPPQYIPIPALTIRTEGDRTVAVGADTRYVAHVYDETGRERTDATVTWTFGDGMRRTGTDVLHAYRAVGEYLVIVRAQTDPGEATTSFVVAANDAGVRIVANTPAGVAIENRDDRQLDLSLWRIATLDQSFQIPAGTILLPSHTVTFVPQVTELAYAPSVTLRFPDGAIAARYPSPAPVQPVVAAVATVSYAPAQPRLAPASSKEVSGATNQASTYEEPVLAPRETATATSRGAAVAASGMAGLLTSPWTYSFFGLVLASGAALILL